MNLSNVPEEYQDLREVFSKSCAATLPPHRPYDCAIDLVPASKCQLRSSLWTDKKLSDFIKKIFICALKMNKSLTGLDWNDMRKCGNKPCSVKVLFSHACLQTRKEKDYRSLQMFADIQQYHKQGKNRTSGGRTSKAGNRHLLSVIFGPVPLCDLPGVKPKASFTSSFSCGFLSWDSGASCWETRHTQPNCSVLPDVLWSESCSTGV
ncbi:uncharacterized protein LOC143749292 [Siphateles boraxobius]|uniref:uncharacterized protein LOC143749292 n=1 Tax=Siphateles boraxobius TaxID=180520 RepID=UPI004063AEEF